MTRAGLTLLCAAQFLVVLDATIVAVALPAIRRDLGFSASSLQWVVSAYALTFGGFLMLLGRAADLYGRRRLFATGFAVFGAASLACGLAPSAGVLLAARAVQGLGAAAVAPAALAILTGAIEPGPRRTRAVGIWTAAAAAGGALGWVVGGVITQALGWEWVFLVNVAPAALAVALAPRLLPEGRDETTTRLDTAGALTVTAGLALLILALTRAEAAGPAAPSTLLSAAAAALLLAAFAAVERRARAPLMPPGVLRTRALTGSLLGALVITTASTGPLFLCVLYLQDVLERSPTETGLLFAPFNLAVVAGSVAGSRITERREAATATLAGLGLIAAGSLALVSAPASGGPPPLLPAAFAAMGLGVGCASVASTAAGTAAVDAGRQGLASGLLNTAAQIGNALGYAAFVVLAAAIAGPAAADAETVTAYHWAFAAAAVLAVAGGLAGRALQRAR